MKYLKIQNNGELDIMGLFLMGASTKRGDEKTIGEFGSGWKYALAVLLRNNIYFTIYSGQKAIDVTTRAVDLRYKTFSMIVIDGKDTNYTTEMGPEWEIWMAIREIYSNALDEGGCTIAIETCDDPMNHGIGKTTITVEITEQVQNIIDNWQSYFAFERTDDLLDVPGKLKVYHAINPNKSIIYRKGIKVAESNSPGCFDYDFYTIPINELRVAKNFEDVKKELKSAMLLDFKSEVINPILNNKSCWENSINFESWDWMRNKGEWSKALHRTTIVPAEYSEKLKTTTETPTQVANNGLLQIPNSLCKLISTTIPEITIIGYTGTGQVCLPATISPEFKDRVNQAANTLYNFGFTDIIVDIADFDNSYKTAISKSDGRITVSSMLNDKPVSLLTTVILREALIIRSGHDNPSSMLTDYICSVLLQALNGGSLIVSSELPEGLPF